MHLFKNLSLPPVPWRQFAKELNSEINKDNVYNGAAALAYYLTLAIFPSMIVLLGVLPFLPISNLQQQVMGLLSSALPGEAAKMFSGVVTEITQHKQGGVLSIGLLLALWSSSSGMYAIMQQLNITYDVKEGRSFIKVRATSIGLTLLFGILIIGALALVIFGGDLIDWGANALGMGSAAAIIGKIVRWVITAAAIMFALAVVYYKGPDVKQSFKFVTLGSVLGTILLGAACAGFKVYVDNFGSYDKTYGSIGAVIILMFWLYVTGLIILLGSEVNSLVEHYTPGGKEKGEKVPGEKALGQKAAA